MRYYLLFRPGRNLECDATKLMVFGKTSVFILQNDDMS